MPAAAESGLALKVPGCWIFSTGRGRAREVEPLEHVGAADHGPARQAAGQDLGERGEVGGDAEVRLRAARRHAKAGDHLVEDQQHAVRRGQLAQRARGSPAAAASCRTSRRSARSAPPRCRRSAASSCAQRVRVVRARAARTLAATSASTPGGRRAVEMALVARGHVVVPAVEVGLEADDLAPAGERAREPHRHQRRLGAGRGEAHPLGARHQPPDRLGPAHLERMARAEVRAARRAPPAPRRRPRGGCGRAAARRGRRSSRRSGCHRRPICTGPAARST